MKTIFVKQIEVKGQMFRMEIETDTGLPQRMGIGLPHVWYTVTIYDDHNYFIKTRVTEKNLFKTIKMQEEFTKSLFEKEVFCNNTLDIALNALGFTQH